MKTEEEIIRQIKYFHNEWNTYSKMLANVDINSDYQFHRLEAIEREIEALEWVIGKHIEWD